MPNLLITRGWTFNGASLSICCYLLRRVSQSSKIGCCGIWYNDFPDLANISKRCLQGQASYACMNRQCMAS